MRNFKKILGACLLFILVFGAVTYPFFHLYLISDYYIEDSDLKTRRSYAGTLDYLVVGASQAQHGIDTRILDQELGRNGYNLSSSLQNLYQSKQLLETELNRNPVKTVVLAVSDDTFVRSPRTDTIDADYHAMPRLENWGQRIDYIANGMWERHYKTLFKVALTSGFKNAGQLLTGHKITGNTDPSLKGFLPSETKDVSLTVEEARRAYRRSRIGLYEVQDKNLELFREMVEMSRTHGADVLIITVPNSDANILDVYKWEPYHEYLQEIAADNQCDLFDFNLLKARYEILSDSDCYMDKSHLSTEGAARFTKALAQVLKAREEGKDQTDLFYTDYESMRADSPYKW